jgi:hypothetical protein
MTFEESATFLTLDLVAGPHAGQSYQLSGHATCLVGRGPAGVQLAAARDQGVSRVHFLVEYHPPRARVADLRSKNGTFLNGRRIDQADLHDGDEVRAGQTTLKVKLPPRRPHLGRGRNAGCFGAGCGPPGPLSGQRGGIPRALVPPRSLTTKGIVAVLWRQQGVVRSVDVSRTTLLLPAAIERDRGSKWTARAGCHWR